jgi:hypothetical protein
MESAHIFHGFLPETVLQQYVQNSVSVRFLVAQRDSWPTSTAEARVRPKSNPCGSSGGHSGSGTVSPPRTCVVPCHRPSTNSLDLSSSVIGAKQRQQLTASLNETLYVPSPRHFATQVTHHARHTGTAAQCANDRWRAAPLVHM